MMSSRIRSGLFSFTFSRASMPSVAVRSLTGSDSRNACNSSTFCGLSSTIRTVDCGRNDSVFCRAVCVAGAGGAATDVGGLASAMMKHSIHRAIRPRQVSSGTPRDYTSIKWGCKGLRRSAAVARSVPLKHVLNDRVDVHLLIGPPLGVVVDEEDVAARREPRFAMVRRPRPRPRSADRAIFQILSERRIGHQLGVDGSGGNEVVLPPATVHQR